MAESERERTLSEELENLGSRIDQSSPWEDWSIDFKKVTCYLWVPISSSVKWGSYDLLDCVERNI